MCFLCVSKIQNNKYPRWGDESKEGGMKEGSQRLNDLPEQEKSVNKSDNFLINFFIIAIIGFEKDENFF